MDLATVGPASPGARAQLLLALAVCAIFPTLYVLTPQSYSHAVTFDSIYGLAPDGAAARVETPVWMEPAPLRRDRGATREDFGLAAVRGARHEVAVNAAGTFLLDGCAVDAVTLRTAIDLVEQAGDGWFDLRPDGEARWEAVDTALAIFARAHVGHFRFDNRRFRGAIDAPGSAKRTAQVAPRNCPPSAVLD